MQSLSSELVWVRRLYNVMARRSGRAVIPADGELVPFVFITHFCAETPDDLRALLLRIREDLDPSTHLYFDIAFDVTDPLVRALDGFWKTSLEFGLYWITPPGIEPPAPLEKPVYFDMAFV